ncbi:Nucleotidyltransferase [Rhizodiscina lignyota]|uniref:polynucleotide adenylyltransferase n=1 Tax=Rhizodiscina lignyota TaxID=1504668 RepID=A0A9P4ICM6_9PEZI|nr:Nucleotidyltransferase [Rhizodiscina lignyota]
MFHFHGQASRGQGDGPYNDARVSSASSNGARNEEFNFRSNAQGTGFERSFPGPVPNHGIPTGPRRDRQMHRGGFKPRGASDRVILKARRETTPERLSGMQEGHTSFKALQDLSDSEAEMEIASDAGSGIDGVDGQPTAKRAQKVKPFTADELPKWSNPDPYTALPPPDESQGKKKDIVKLIQKAKITIEQEQQAASLAADNADFISFGLDEDDDLVTFGSMNESLGGFPGAAAPDVTHAQKFSHLDNLHPNRSMRSAATTLEYENDDTEIPPPPPMPPQPQVHMDRNKNKRKRKPEVTGQITEEWMGQLIENNTPWCRADYSESKQMTDWLHREIVDFYEYLKPQSFERDKRENLIDRISNSLQKRFPGGTLHSFGSFGSGIYLPTADMDLVFLSPVFSRYNQPAYTLKKGFLYQVRHWLIQEGIALSDAECILGAKVPIVKFTDKLSNIKVDISIENNTGLIANNTFRAWKEQFPAMPIIATLIKQFLHMRNLNEVFTGGLGGFSITCLVTSLLQHLPAAQSGSMRPEEHLGELLLDFFDFYGNRFDLNKVVISLNPPQYFPKVRIYPEDAQKKPDRLCILDPNRPANDISGGSSKAQLVMSLFSEAYAAILKRMTFLESRGIEGRKGASILGSVFAGDYSSFEHQRNLLANLPER